MHSAAFGALGLTHEYELRDVAPEDLAGAVDGLRSPDTLGANVTVPHKERIVPFLDAVAPEALRIGAVNTVVKTEDRLRGENTDRAGFTAALDESGVFVRGKRVLVLGAGGAARAVIIALTKGGARIEVANRTQARARLLASLFGVTAVAWPERLDGYDLVVNATSAGLHGEDPLAGMALPRKMVVVDLVPMREETVLLTRARAEGCVVVDGLLMLLHQAAGSFTLWTGREAPLEAMRAALPRMV
ncbi:MAG: shikimate dehydrogenase [Chloroflexi bacterium]|nr:shikimate dehydrogenase [Chloroflexota bacterium]